MFLFLLLPVLAYPVLSQNVTLDRRQSTPKLKLIGSSIVSPIHIVQQPRTGKLLLIDRLEGGLKISSEEFHPIKDKSRTLNLQANVFCSSGFISPAPNARIYSVGGTGEKDANGIRYFIPCVSDKCDWNSKSSLRALRWYPSSLPLPNGRVAVIGGSESADGGNQPTLELLPHRQDESVIELSLLKELPDYVWYPIAHVLSNGQIFLMAGDRSQLLHQASFKTLKELPKIEGDRTYPLTGGSVLLPLRPQEKYKAEVLVCGGGSKMEDDAPALKTCGRILPTSKDPKWLVEDMPGPRIMPDMVLLPDGTVYLGNGAKSGYAGFGITFDAAYDSLIYNPNAPVGQRFKKAAESKIARLYHSEALLLEDGRVLVSGSVPHAFPFTENEQFPNEKRIEVYEPDYLKTGKPRPELRLQKVDWSYNLVYNSIVKLPSKNVGKLKALLMTNGFVTHSTHQVILTFFSWSEHKMMTHPNTT